MKRFKRQGPWDMGRRTTLRPLGAGKSERCHGSHARPSKSLVMVLGSELIRDYRLGDAWAGTLGRERLGGNAWGGTLGRNLWTATKQVLKARIWTRISESSIVFHGDSEKRSPEADFGLPGAENPTFSIFRFF